MATGITDAIPTRYMAHPVDLAAVDLDAQFVDQTQACMSMVSVTAFTHGPWTSLPLLVS
jgi:hypothetical protein